MYLATFLKLFSIRSRETVFSAVRFGRLPLHVQLRVPEVSVTFAGYVLELREHANLTAAEKN